MNGAGSARNFRDHPSFFCCVATVGALERESPMNGIIYIVGLVVVVLAILSFLGLR